MSRTRGTGDLRARINQIGEKAYLAKSKSMMDHEKDLFNLIMNRVNQTNWEKVAMEATQNTIYVGALHEKKLKEMMKSVSYDLGYVGPFSQELYMQYTELNQIVALQVAEKIQADDFTLEPWSGMRTVKDPKTGQEKQEYGHYFLAKCTFGGSGS